MSKQAKKKRNDRASRHLGAVALLFGLAVSVIALPRPAFAKPCGLRDDLVGVLKQTHKEKPAAIGLTSTGRLMEIFAASNGNWTILVTRASGRSCVVATGQAWSAIVPEKPSA